MRFLSDTNPAIPHFAFHIPSADRSSAVHSKLIEAIAQIVRWTIAGILVLVVAVPAIISVQNSI